MISFRKLTFKNILSVGNQPVSIDLDYNKTTLIHGENGSGKSTILDALCYVLFGKSFRGVNLTQLVNSQNKKGLLVECEFTIGNNHYLVRRGMKPRVFEVYKNEEIIDAQANDRENQQYLEQNILKLTYKSFTQIVILGSSNFVPFMQLNSSGRRECVEDFLDIKVFSTMATIAKERLRGTKEQQRILDIELSSLEFKIDTLQDKINDMNQRDVAEIGKYEEKIAECRHDINNAETILEGYYRKMRKLTEESDAIEKKGAHKKVKEYNTVIIKLNTKLEQLIKEKEFFEQDECPTCGQGIDYAMKMGVQSRIQKDMEKFDTASVQARELMVEQEKVVEELVEVSKKIRELQEAVFCVQTEIKAHNSTMKNCENYIITLQELGNETEREQAILASLQSDLKEMAKKKQKLTDEIRNLEVVVNLLKDSGIKTQIVKKYLPAMNKYIRHYLTELELPVHFQLDSEFSEVVRSPMHQDFSYQSFSEGQKGRIDLALLFTWREIGRLKNSVTTNLLILDEVFSSSLDEAGKECLLTLLRYRLPEDQRIVVVDHTLSSTFKEKFDYNIEVTRKSGFSRYE